MIYKMYKQILLCVHFFNLWGFWGISSNNLLAAVDRAEPIVHSCLQFADETSHYLKLFGSTRLCWNIVLNMVL